MVLCHRPLPFLCFEGTLLPNHGMAKNSHFKAVDALVGIPDCLLYCFWEPNSSGFLMPMRINADTELTVATM